jgi:hypothetical protein
MLAYLLGLSGLLDYTSTSMADILSTRSGFWLTRLKLAR